MSLAQYTEQPVVVAGNHWVDLVQPAAQLANQIAKTEFVPQEMRGKPDVVAACILYGSEIGIGPMQSLAKVDIVKGRPAPRAELARALALAAGHEIRVEESTNTRVVVAGRRAGSDFWQRVTWTLDDVKKAGITSPMYTKYPRQMLLARASAELVRAFAPDCLGGIGMFAEEVETGETGETGPTLTVVEPITATVGTTRKRKPLRPEPPAPMEIEAPPLPTDELDDEPVRDGLATDPQIRKMVVAFKEMGITDRDDRLGVLSDVCGRPVGSSKELTREEASKVIEHLEGAPIPH